MRQASPIAAGMATPGRRPASHPPPERLHWRGAGSRRDSEAQRTWFAAVAAALLLLGPDAEA